MATELQVDTLTGRSKTLIRDGVTGNYQVIFEMIRVIRNDVKLDKGLESYAKQLLIDHGLDSYSDKRKQLDIIYGFVKNNVKYIQDVAGKVENIKSARVTLSDGFGDCDDMAILIAALVGDIGFEDVKLAMARYNVNEPTFVHVYPVVYIDGKRLVLDATLPNGKVGAEVKAFEVKETPIFDHVQGLDGWSGVFTNIKYTGKKIAKGTVELVPAATNVMPLGFFSGNVLATGANLISQAGSGTLSLAETTSRINQELDKIILDLCASRIAYDFAKSYALQAAAQINAVEVTVQEKENYPTLRASIKKKMDFIRDFKNYAKINNIKVVHSNSQLMLVAGLGVTAIVGYQFYKGYKNSRGY